MTSFKVGDRVRLTGEDWEKSYGLTGGQIVVIDEIDHSIWAGEAGTVGNSRGLYSKENPEGTGDYACELVSGNSEEAILNRSKSFTAPVTKLTIPSEKFKKTKLKEIINFEKTKGGRRGEGHSKEQWESYVGASSFEGNVRRHTDRIVDILVEKNKAYGDSALNPVRVFSKADREEQLYVRIDDKISRIQRGTDFANEDTIDDLIGYLFLLKIAKEGN